MSELDMRHAMAQWRSAAVVAIGIGFIPGTAIDTMREWLDRLIADRQSM